MKAPIQTLLLLSSLTCLNMLKAQQPDHVWLETSKLKVRVNADGRLFCDDHSGAFFIKNGQESTNIARGAGLWFAGMDPGKNLWFAGQTPYLHYKMDFLPGYKGIPNSGKIWKVTRDEVAAHLQDYADNLIVDHPISSIFSWPASGNPYGYGYNQFDHSPLVTGFQFVDTNDDNAYTPEFGDYPTLFSYEWLFDQQVPSQMASFMCYTDTFSQISQSKAALPLQVVGTAYVLDCPENELLSSSVFVNYEFLNISDFDLDSFYVSLCNDFNLGGPDDDYIGYLPERKTLFYYNAPTPDVVFGNQSPLLFISVLDRRSRFSSFSTLFCQDSACSTSLMPFSQPDRIDGQGYPTHLNECYNYMTGSWRNGTPLTVGGNGYNPGNPAAETASYAFPGYPDTPNAWTEWNANNKEEDRSAMINMRMLSMHPGDNSGVTLQFSFLPWEEGSLTERIKKWETEEEILLNLFNCCPGFKFNRHNPSIVCPFNQPGIKKPEPLDVFPNPANHVVKVWHLGIRLKKMVLYDVMGRVLGIGIFRKEYSDIDVSSLVNGVYFLDIETESGEKKVTKIIVEH